MLKIVKISVLMAVLSAFIGCSDSQERELNTTQPIKKVVVEKNDDTLLNEMGFDFKDEKITIDLNRTSNFFSRIEKKMEQKAKELESKIIDADLNVSRDGGIVITDEKFSIDLNQTKTLLDNFSKLFEDIILDINSTFN